MPVISHIKVGDTTYDIRDDTAREQVLPSGGTAGQFLKKSSGTDYDAAWANVVIPEYTASKESIGSASAGTAIKADDITAWSAGTVPTLGTAIPADDITAWAAGSLPSFSYDSETETLTFSPGTLPSLSYTAKSIPNVTNVGTLPSLSYTEKTIPNITVTSKQVVTGISSS